MFAGKVILYLYHVILGKGEPVAEQLILTGSSTPDILTASGGVTVNTGGSEWRLNKSLVYFVSGQIGPLQLVHVVQNRLVGERAHPKCDHIVYNGKFPLFVLSQWVSSMEVCAMLPCTQQAVSFWLCKATPRVNHAREPRSTGAFTISLTGRRTIRILRCG